MTDTGATGFTREWRVVAGFDQYEVSNDGIVVRVRSGGRRRPLKPGLTAKGYHCVVLHQDGKRWWVQVHILVCTAFQGPKPAEKPGTDRWEVAHWDNDKINNLWTNLRWATSQQNKDDRRRQGTHIEGEAISWARLKAVQIPGIRARLAARESCSSIANDLGVSEGAINGIRIGRNWKSV